MNNIPLSTLPVDRFRNSGNFRGCVYRLVTDIPKGKVMTYGQIAALCGSPRAARVVGGIAHYGNPSLPWHRVVNVRGGLARGYPGGRRAHARHLASEGIKILDDYHIDIDSLLWRPDNINSD